MELDSDNVLFRQFDLTEFESEIYLYLLKEGPSTGYSISQGIGKYKTNVYNSLGSMTEKGVVIVDDGDRKVYRSVPPQDILNRRLSLLSELKPLAMQLHQKYAMEKPDNRIYQLKSVREIYGKFREMLEQTRECLLIEIFPGPFTALKETIVQLAARDVSVSVRVYDRQQFEILEAYPNINPVLSSYGTDTFKNWEAQWLSCFSDGMQFLTAFLSAGCDEVFHAIWSQSVIIAWSFYSFVVSDFMFYQLKETVESATDLETVRRKLSELTERHPIDADPGIRLLKERYR